MIRTKYSVTFFCPIMKYTAIKSTKTMPKPIPTQPPTEIPDCTDSCESLPICSTGGAFEVDTTESGLLIFGDGLAPGTTIGVRTWRRIYFRDDLSSSSLYEPALILVRPSISSLDSTTLDRRERAVNRNRKRPTRLIFTWLNCPVVLLPKNSESVF